MIYLSLFLTAVSLLFPFSSVKTPRETPYTRNYFYVGGIYTDNGNGEHVFKGQMYVEQLTPLKGPTKQYPILFIHGQGQSGTNWLNKPDGGRGWASYFLSQGYEVYIIDQTFRGRSAWFPGNGTMSMLSAEQLQRYFTATARYNLWPQATLHTQWPGSGMMGDKTFDNYYASTVQFLDDEVYQQAKVQEAGVALLDHLNRQLIIISHSQGTVPGWLIADGRPDLVRSIVAIEPGGPPFENVLVRESPARAYGLTDVPLTYVPAVKDPENDLAKQRIPPNSSDTASCLVQADTPSPRRLVNLAKTAVLVVTAESSYHAVYDWCDVTYLQQAGVSAEHLQLGKVGIHGNGHMVFLEKNSDDVAAEIQKWIERNDGSSLLFS